MNDTQTSENLYFQYGLVTGSGRFIVIAENITWLQLIASQLVFALMTVHAAVDILRGVVYHRPKSHVTSHIIGLTPEQERRWQIVKIWLRQYLFGVVELAVR